jgi:hypothetical protein
MKKIILVISLSAGIFLLCSGQRPWQNFSDKSIREIKQEFQNPSAEFGMILWWGWDGPMSDIVIKRDLENIRSMGFRGVMIEAGYGMTAKYLSPEWFEMVKTGVAEAKKRGMTVWIEDEGKYPSGFAGGKFSTERPDLKMQGLVVTDRIDIKNGETVTRKISPGTLSAVAVNLNDNSIKIIDISSGELNWPTAEGNWRIIVAGHQFRSSVTRSVNNPTRGKDTTASLMDYLNPLATKQFIEWTHEQYKKYFGNEFGKTFLGFMGDEPDFAYTPYTPAILKEFKDRKGYDVQPYLAAFFAPQLSEEISLVKADYWDVWSDLFRDNFFKVQADWCRQNNIEYIVHLNHEDQLPGLAKSSGDFFKNMRYVGVPGVDAIWSQIWMDHVADYPKLASSAAHLFGRPRAFTESFAAYTHRPTVPQAKWVLDYQLVRGINSIQIMFMSASTQRSPQIPAGITASVPPRTSFFESDTFPPVAAYFNRAAFLLSQGRPACKIGLFVPTSSMWYGDNASNENLLSISQNLLENQYDFDFIDEQSLSSVMTIKNGSFVNLSGQEYTAIIIPESTLFSKISADRLKEFASSGGKVIYLGTKPLLIADKNFLAAKNSGDDITGVSPDISGLMNPKLFKALPEPDLKSDIPCKSVKYIHRNLKDGELYFIFNEGIEKQLFKVTLTGKGTAEEWNSFTGQIEKLNTVSQDKNRVIVQLELQPRETKFIVINN